MQTGKQTKKIKDMTKNIQFLFCLIVKQRSGKQYVIIKFFLSVLDGVFPLVGTVVPGLIINELTDGRISYVLVLYVIILLMFPVLQGLIQTGLKNYLFRLTEQIKMFNLKEFYEHVTKMDYEMLEQPDIQDRKNHASKILNDSLSVVEEIGSFMRALVSMILISSIITTLNPIITIVIIGSVLIDAKITKNLKQKNYETQKKIWDKARRQWGFGYMLETFDFAKDLRIFSVGELLIQKFLNNERSINIDKKRMNTDSYKASIQSVLLAFLNQVILYIYLIYMVVVKDLAVGSMTIFLSATGQFSNSLSSVMQSYLSLSATALRVDDFREFMQIPLHQYQSGTRTPKFDENSVIEFKNVSFKYPGSETYAIHHLNLSIKGNEKLCIVGVNGAGKSTFIKLLVRLYFPTEGEIFLNGYNINEYDYEQYQRLFAAVFQDYSKFYMTIRENIVLEAPFNQEKFDQVCNRSGLSAFAEKLPDQYNTQIGKWFDEKGVVPSGGEGQRIAIARACYHGGEIFLLDEPAAALDPIAEYEIYTQFANMIMGKSAILITHRLSAVQLADKVAVFEDGQIIEYGTHQELYSNGGTYTEMYNRQARFYQGKTFA